jgi:hypothetical protein
MPIALKLLAILKYVLTQGPTIITLVHEIIALIQQMPGLQDRAATGYQLGLAVSQAETKADLITRLQDLKCSALGRCG